MLATVSSASAETFYLTETSEDVSGIRIEVVFNGTHISVRDVSPALVGVPNVDIKAIRLYLDDTNVTSVTDDSGSGSINVWTHAPSYKSNFAGFGEFNTLCNKATDSIKSRGPIVIALSPSFNQPHLPENSLKNSIVVHLGFGTELIDVGGADQDSSWVTGSAQIPEFSSIALPVATIMGIMFFMGRRRKE
ncbi:PEF-CTERM sorting domain-containing protein [Methanosarcina sp. KYL-1]|uniref:PEF-CTERM sorting domain-containing protein n=1 Tax=Methanosarcina sp. KYL-1 TaxID=2602068 RepID=UPI002101B333|nr:PEF-CTERM sorting domain-containing protein [Methanosarcina sp. KYL-1]MCQ1536531.1 PEF-CTERM sorting domain-containing protein [Methanosarcina sp. KYL-1]